MFKFNDVVVITKTLETEAKDSPQEGDIGLVYPERFHYLNPAGFMRYAIKVNDNIMYWMVNANEIEKIGEL